MNIWGTTVSLSDMCDIESNNRRLRKLPKGGKRYRERPITTDHKLSALAASVVVVLSIVVPALILMPGAATAANQEACQTELAQEFPVWGGSDPASSCHILGGQAEQGALKIFVADGLIHVERYNGTGWMRQYYTYGGAVLNVDSELYSLGYYNDQDDPSGFWGSLTQYVEPTSQSRSGDTVTTVWNIGDIQIEQRIRYTDQTAQFYDLEWGITNTGSTSLSNVHFLRGEDTYLAGDDDGNGTWNPDTNTVGVEKTLDGTRHTLVFQGITDPAGYRSARYSKVISDVESGSLNNSVNPSHHDNGFALEWATSTLDASETWQIQAIESFVRSSLSVTGGGAIELNGTTATPSFNVENVAETAQSVSYSLDCPSGWECQVPDSESIDGGSSTTVSPSITPPSNTDPGTYSVALTATSQSSRPAQGIAQIEIPETSSEQNTTSNGSSVVDFDAPDVAVDGGGESEGESVEGEQEGEDQESDQEQEGDQDQEDQGESGETTAAVQTTQENGQTQVQATVQNAQGGEPVEMQVSSDAEADVDPDTAPAQLTSVSITPASDATFSLEITESPEPLDSSPEFNLGDGTTPVSYLSVEHSLPNTEIDQASMTYRVSEQSLEAMDSSPEDVSMYRYDGDSWSEQPTQVVGMDDGAAILQTTADGLSEWTAAAKRPRLNVTDTQVSVQAATTEEEVTIQVFVTNTGGTDGVYEAELLLNDDTVDQTERTVPDGGTVAVNFERTFGQPGLYEVQVNDVFVGEVNISAADESVDVETAANASIEAQEPANASDANGGGGGFPVLPAGIVLVLAAALGVWLYMTRLAE